MANIRTKIQLRNDTSANWQSANTLLLKGEFGFDTDNMYIKIGDGTTRWNDLSTVRLPKAAIDGLQDVDTNTIYQLSNITDMTFSLVSADGTLETPVWTVVSTFNAKDWTETIATVSAAAVAEAGSAADAKDAAVSALTKNEVIGQDTDLSTASTIYGAKEYANVLANAAKETAIATAAEDAKTKADNALTAANAYTNKVSADLDALETSVESIATRVGTAETNIQGLQDISASHDSRIAANETSITDIRTTLNVVSSDYLKSSDKTDLEGKIVAAQQAAELSAQTVRDDLTSYVKYSDVTQAVTETNKIVTQDDIKDLSGAMHFIGIVNPAEGETVTQALVRTFPNARKGDVAIVQSSAEEYVYVSDVPAKEEHWHLLGVENVYATKAELEAEATERSTADTALGTRIDNEETARSTADTALGNRITGVENSLSDYALSVDVSAIHSALNSSIAAVASDLATETTTRAAEDTFISGRVDNKVKVGTGTYSSTTLENVNELSIVKIADEDYYKLIAEGKQNDSVVYIVSSDNVNGHDERVINVGEAISATDAVNLSGMNAALNALNSLSGVTLNGQAFTTANGVASLTVEVISCGGAEA